MKPTPVTNQHAKLYLFTAVLVGVLIATGGVVCMTDASAGCPDWPGCYGRVVPPMRMKSIIEWTHRVVAALTLPPLLLSAVVGWRRYRTLPWLSVPPILAIFALLAVVVFGAAVVLWGLPRSLAAMDLGCALLTLALAVLAAGVARANVGEADTPRTPSFGMPLARLALATLGFVFVVFLGGVLVAEPGSVVRCLGLPYWGSPPQTQPFLGLHWARLALGVVAGLMLVGLVVKTRRSQPALSGLLAGLLAAEVTAGVWLTVVGVTDVALIVNVALATALWAVLVALVTSVAVTAELPTSSPSV